MHVEYLWEAGLDGAADRLPMPRGRPVLIVVGGSSNMAAEAERMVREILRSVVLPVTRETGVVVVDGGTDSGPRGL